MQFPVVLHTDDRIRYGVTMPDLPGCFSGGDSYDEALTCAVESIDLHLDGLVEAGNKIPAPHSIAHHRRDAAYAGGLWAEVQVDVASFRGQAVFASAFAGQFAVLPDCNEVITNEHINRLRDELGI